MILNGNQRGNATDLALHLMKDENEIVELHELRGFVSGDLMGALNEIHAIAQGIKCRQYLYSLSLNPPLGENVSNDIFRAAIEQAEERLGLSGQPRVIVFHEKNGRRHAHVVWSRIDIETMKAKQMSHDREKLTRLSRELYLQHGWEMPNGIKQRGGRDPLNYSHAEHQQAQRVGKDAKVMKHEIRAAWLASDSKSAFEHAITELGYILARGDRRSFVLVDMDGEVYSLPRMAGVKTKEVRARLGDENLLPSIEQVRAMLAERQKHAPQSELQDKRKANGIHTPDDAIALVGRFHSAFTLPMMERTLKRRVKDNDLRKGLIDSMLQSNEVIEIGERNGKAVYTTKSMMALEQRMREDSACMVQTRSHHITEQATDRAISTLNAKLAEATNGTAHLSEQQCNALRHMASDKQLSLVVGVAGAGKTTIMEGAKLALQAQGYRVRGAAPSGIAASGLQEVGIQSSTLHSLEARLELAQQMLDENAGKPLTEKQQAFIKSAMLTDKDVLIVDEAGMVSAKQLANIISHCKQSGAKLVLVGDPEQLQSIEAGTAFRDLLDENSSVSLTEVRRQQPEWQREATLALSQNRTAEALHVYDAHGLLSQQETCSDAKTALADDFMQSYMEQPDKSRLVLAYTRNDVDDLNRIIKEQMVQHGIISNQDSDITITVKEDDHEVQRKQGFAAGDRILFRKNDKVLGVMNGTFGTLESISNGRMTVTLDSGRSVLFSTADYNHIQLGYAATVHKSQGVTVDESYVLASPHFDKHTAYVAMSRHKHQVKLYSSREDFKSKDRLFNALGKDGEKLSTLQFIKAQRNKLRLQEHPKTMSACLRSVWNYLWGKPQFAPSPETKIGNTKHEAEPVHPQSAKTPSMTQQQMEQMRNAISQQKRKPRHIQPRDNTRSGPSPER